MRDNKDDGKVFSSSGCPVLIFDTLLLFKQRAIKVRKAGEKEQEKKAYFFLMQTGGKRH